MYLNFLGKFDNLPPPLLSDIIPDFGSNILGLLSHLKLHIYR